METENIKESAKSELWNAHFEESYLDVADFMKQARELLEDETPTLDQVIALAGVIQRQFVHKVTHFQN